MHFDIMNISRIGLLQRQNVALLACSRCSSLATHEEPTIAMRIDTKTQYVP